MRNTISDLIQESKRSSYKSKIEQGQGDPRSIWRIFKELVASNKASSDDEYFAIKEDETIISDETEIAKNFNGHFVNTASKLKEPIEHNDFSILREHINSKILENMHFELPDIDEPFVFKFSSALAVSKSTDLDGASGAITKSIKYIANKCISQGNFSSSWKRARVNPLHKGGAKDDINNYRPISILPTSSKLLEKFIQIKLTNFLNEYDVLHQTQSGFRSKHSTETALTFMTEDWLKAINDG